MKVKYLSIEKNRHGNTRYYYRAPGMLRVRLYAEPDTPEFYEEIARAKRNAVPKDADKTAARPPGSLGFVIKHYKASRAYRDLNPKTRTVRDRLLLRIDKKVGHYKVSLVTRSVLKKWRDEPEGHEAGNAIVKTLRQVFKVACEDELMAGNPAMDVAYRKGNRDGWEAWEMEDVVKFVNRHPKGTMAYKAMMLLLFTGQRISDVYQMGPQHVRDGWLVINQVKNAERRDRERVRVEIPILDPLFEVLQLPASHHAAFLVSSYGVPFQSEKSFANWFKKRAREAGIEKPQHGIRKALGDLLATMGATEHQIMAVLGHSTSKQAEIYTRRANRRRLAGEGMNRTLGELKWNEIVAPSTSHPDGATISNLQPTEKRREK